MNKAQFIQQASITFRLDPKILAMDQEKQRYAVIKMAENQWEALKERGYGAPKRSTKEEPQGYYGELPESSRIAFDKLWKASGKLGGRDNAARQWGKLLNPPIDQMLYAMKVYRDGLGDTAQANLSTWIFQKRWEGFEPPKATESAVNKDKQEIAGLEKMIDMAKDEESKAALRAQVITLIEGMKI